METESKDTVIINGIEYVPKVVVPEPVPVKVGRWKPKEGEDYWSFDPYNIVNKFCWKSYVAWLPKRYAMGNVYQTEELALHAHDKQLLLVELQDYADKCNGEEDGTLMYFYLINYNKFWGRNHTIGIIPGTVLFKNSSDVLSAIEHFGKRLDLLL